jgi:CheY-like chemotaxis protein
MVPTLILQPLVENAIRHGLEPMVRPGTLTIEAQADGDTLWLRVRDDGAGLPKNWTRREGVGLTNSRSRLDRLYGEQAALTVRDNPGGGVLVDIYIPFAPPPQGYGGQAAVDARGGGVMIRVLVADDQPMARERLVSLLAAEPGIEVAGTAASGPEAIDCIRAASPDLVFLDLQMPGMDGFKVIEAIGVDRMPAIVFVTAYDEYAVRAFDVQALITS